MALMRRGAIAAAVAGAPFRSAECTVRENSQHLRITVRLAHGLAGENRRGTAEAALDFTGCQ
ncbi:hypothetical protein D3C78_1442470 [compost metagenome]